MEKIKNDSGININDKSIKAIITVQNNTGSAQLIQSKIEITNLNDSLYNRTQINKTTLFEESNEFNEPVDEHIFINDNELGVQKYDIKYATFDDPYINPLDLRNITYKETEEDLKNLIASVDILEKKYLSLLALREEKIDEFFNTYSLCKYCANIFIIGLKRILTLALLILKTRFEPLEKTNVERLIINEYLFADEIYINNFFDHSNFKEIAKNDNEKFLLFIDIFKLLKHNESFIANMVKSEFVPSLSGISFAIKAINIYIECTLKDCETLLSGFNEEIVVELLLNLERIKIFNKMIPFTFNIPSDDLFNLAENSETWVKLKKNITRVIKNSKYAMKKKLQKLFEFVSIGNASITTGHQINNEILKFIGTGFYFAFYFFNKKQAINDTKKSFLNSNFDLSRKVWNLLDTKVIKSGYNGVLFAVSNIKFRKKLYLKKTEKTINLEFLRKLNEEIRNGFIDKTQEKLFSRMGAEMHEKKDELLNSINNKIKGDLYVLERDESVKDEYVKIKLLHGSDLTLPKFENKVPFFSCCTNNKNYTRNSLIFHVHGGGFVAMSSSSHENYLRKWSNSLNVPVVSVDYRLAPEFPFPNAIDDVWQAYNWVLKYAEEEFNIELQNIVVVGDSAGGNLILALMYLLIYNNKKLPKAVFLAYPAMRVDDQYFSPSFILCMKDLILPYHLLIFCLQAYKGEFEDGDNMFLSPILAPNHLLKMFPPVRIITGSADPLRDDSYRFLKKLVDSNVDAKLIELKYFPHGFLSYDVPMMMPDANISNDYIIKEMNKFFKSEE